MYYRLHFNLDLQSVPFYTDRFWQSSWLKNKLLGPGLFGFLKLVMLKSGLAKLSGLHLLKWLVNFTLMSR